MSPWTHPFLPQVWPCCEGKPIDTGRNLTPEEWDWYQKELEEAMMPAKSCQSSGILDNFKELVTPKPTNTAPIPNPYLSPPEVPTAE